MQYDKEPQMAKNNLDKEEKCFRTHITDFKIYFKVIVSKNMVLS